MTKQWVTMTVGCPGSGKTTFAQKCNPESVVLCLDDFRTALFRDKQFYHKAAADTPSMRALLNDAYEDALRTALGYGFNLVLANMHIHPKSFESSMTIIKRFGIVPDLAVFKVPLLELFRRNETRPVADRVPEDFLRQMFDDMNAPDVWWRTHRGQAIIIEG